MKRIIVVGNTLPGISVLEQLKGLGEELTATVVCQDHAYPYQPNLLPDYCAGRIKEKQVLCRSGEGYENSGIQFLFDQKIQRLNFRRQRVVLDEQLTCEYDYLILADLPRDPLGEIKGANKEGVYRYNRLGDMNRFLKSLPLLETVVIQSGNISAMKTALSLLNQKREVIWVTSGTQWLENLEENEESRLFKEMISRSGLRILSGEQIAEILGDTQLKAIRLGNGKVIACQAILCKDDLPDLRLLKETDVGFNERVFVNDHFQTKYENVFALGAVCDRIISVDSEMSAQYSELAQAMAGVVAEKIAGKSQTQVNFPEITWTVDRPLYLSDSSSEEDLSGNSKIYTFTQDLKIKSSSINSLQKCS